MRLIDADSITYESIDSSDTARYEYKYGTGILAVQKEDIDSMPTVSEKLIDKDKLMTLLMDLDLDHVQSQDGRELCQIVEDFPTVN